MQRLLSGGEGVKKREAGIARYQLVVPPQQELDRDGDRGRCLGQRLMACEAENGSSDPQFDRSKGNTDRAAHRHSPKPHRATRADVIDALQGIHSGPPLGNRPRRQPNVIPGDLRADGFACSHPSSHACREPLVLLGSRTAAVSGGVDGRHREAAHGHVTVGPSQQTRGAFFCWPPPWPSSTNGRLPVAAAGDQSTPGISPSMNRRSGTPFKVVSEVKRIGF